MDNTSLLQMSHEFVRELHLAEERFLEVLLSAFDIVRRKSPDRGFDLHVSFDEKTRSIWDRNGIRYLRKEVLAEDKRKEHQARLDTFLYKDGAGMLTPDGYSFSDKNFVFRYVSGGTLPVVSFLDDPDSKEYYCLTYREVDPIGWNLINGGSDNRDELLDPEQTIKRELHEELIIADPIQKRRYVFPSESGSARDLPVHAVARKLWDGLLPHKCLKDLTVVDVNMEWIDGPDSVHIRMGDDAPVIRSGFFLNINGLDFGIELDKIARIKIPKTAVMFFGETDRGHLLNCPIGLFNVNRFSPDRDPEELQSEAFRPDLFFFNGKLHRYGEIDGVLAGDFIGQLRGHLWPEALAKFEACLGDEARYSLCPVTARIILRHRRWEAEAPDNLEKVRAGSDGAHGGEKSEMRPAGEPGLLKRGRSVSAQPDDSNQIDVGGHVVDLSKQKKGYAFLAFLRKQLKDSRDKEFLADTMRDRFNAQFDEFSETKIWRSKRMRDDLFKGVSREDFDLIFETLDYSSGRFRLKI